MYAPFGQYDLYFTMVITCKVYCAPINNSKESSGHFRKNVKGIYAKQISIYGDLRLRDL